VAAARREVTDNDLPPYLMESARFQRHPVERRFAGNEERTVIGELDVVCAPEPSTDLDRLIGHAVRICIGEGYDSIGSPLGDE
jgi:hypothetical protein